MDSNTTNANTLSTGSESVAEQALLQVAARAHARHQPQNRAAHSERTVQRVVALNRVVYRVARHWLLAVNSFLFLYVGQLFLAPVLVATGLSRLARPIYAFNGLFCHQDPDRSFFVFGQKMACCERCAAIYGGMFLLGLFYIACRHRKGVLRQPSWLVAGLLAIPLVLDGGAQRVGIHSSNAALRVITGVLFAAAICWVLFPYLDNGFATMRRRIEERFARLVAEGRAQPL